MTSDRRRNARPPLFNLMYLMPATTYQSLVARTADGVGVSEGALPGGTITAAGVGFGGGYFYNN